MTHEAILLTDHQSNKDPTAKIVVSDRQRGEIVRVSGGFLAILPAPVLPIHAIAGLFESPAKALAAIGEIMKQKEGTP